MTVQAIAIDGAEERTRWGRRFLSTNSELAPAILRTVLGAVMLPHGAQKLLGWFGGYGFTGTMRFFTEAVHIPAPVAFLAIVAESFGAIALIAGVLTRAAAFGIFAVQLGAIVTTHLPVGFFMDWFGQKSGEGCEYGLLALGMTTALMVAGGGRGSIDRVLAARS